MIHGLIGFLIQALGVYALTFLLVILAIKVGLIELVDDDGSSD